MTTETGELRESVAESARQLGRRGLVLGTAGNVSVREYEHGTIRSALTTSSHAHPVPSLLPPPSLLRTMMIVAATPKRLPHSMPNVIRPACLLTPRSSFQPQSLGQNCEYTTTQNIQACTPKAKSLNRTVGSGESGWRTAYCARTTGE